MSLSTSVLGLQLGSHSPGAVRDPRISVLCPPSFLFLFLSMGMLATDLPPRNPRHPEHGADHAAARQAQLWLRVPVQAAEQRELCKESRLASFSAETRQAQRHGEQGSKRLALKQPGQRTAVIFRTPVAPWMWAPATSPQTATGCDWPCKCGRADRALGGGTGGCPVCGVAAIPAASGPHRRPEHQLCPRVT